MAVGHGLQLPPLPPLPLLLLQHQALQAWQAAPGLSLLLPLLLLQ